MEQTAAHRSRVDGRAPLELPAGASLEPPNQAFLAYSAFGQENVTATALQNAMVAEGIADNGVVMTPHVMAEIRDSQGRLVQTYQPTKYLQATSAVAAEQANTLMQSVVTSPLGPPTGSSTRHWTWRRRRAPHRPPLRTALRRPTTG